MTWPGTLLPPGIWVHHWWFIRNSNRLSGGPVHRRRIRVEKFERGHDTWERLWRKPNQKTTGWIFWRKT
jgi:hypothetical protein